MNWKHLRTHVWMFCVLCACREQSANKCDEICARLTLCALLPSALGMGDDDCRYRCQRSRQSNGLPSNDAERQPSGVEPAATTQDAAVAAAVPVYNHVERCFENNSKHTSSNACAEDCSGLASCLEEQLPLQPNVVGVGSLLVVVKTSSGSALDAGPGDASLPTATPAISCQLPQSPEPLIHCDSSGDAGAECSTISLLCKDVTLPLYIEAKDRDGVVHATPAVQCRELFASYAFPSLAAGQVAIRVRSVLNAPSAPTQAASASAAPKAQPPLDLDAGAPTAANVLPPPTLRCLTVAEYRLLVRAGVNNNHVVRLTSITPLVAEPAEGEPCVNEVLIEPPRSPGDAGTPR